MNTYLKSLRKLIITFKYKSSNWKDEKNYVISFILLKQKFNSTSRYDNLILTVRSFQEENKTDKQN